MAEHMLHLSDGKPAVVPARIAEEINTLRAQLAEARAAMKAEREACAKIAEARELNVPLYPSSIEEAYEYISMLQRLLAKAREEYGRHARVLIPNYCPSRPAPSISMAIRARKTEGE